MTRPSSPTGTQTGGTSMEGGGRGSGGNWSPLEKRSMASMGFIFINKAKASELLAASLPPDIMLGSPELLALLLPLMISFSGMTHGSADEPVVRLVGGASRCAGDLERRHEGDWRQVGFSTYLWTLKTASVLCRHLDCGSPVAAGRRAEFPTSPKWGIGPACAQSGSDLTECAEERISPFLLTLTCSDSVRLVNGTSLCSGRLEVNSNQSSPSWSSVCEADFDQQDVQVVCRQLGCGDPPVLQGALYGEGEAPMGTTEFQCGGNESALLDCRSASERSTCSPGSAVSLTCSEPVRLVGGESRCAGDLEVNHEGEWRPVGGFHPPWTLKEAAAICRDLDCGSAVSTGRRDESPDGHAWWIITACLQSGSALRECAGPLPSTHTLTLTCADLLPQPNISVSSSIDGVSGAQ